jgi:hypothetical protein
MSARCHLAGHSHGTVPATRALNLTRKLLKVASWLDSATGRAWLGVPPACTDSVRCRPARCFDRSSFRVRAPGRALKTGSLAFKRRQGGHRPPRIPPGAAFPLGPTAIMTALRHELATSTNTSRRQVLALAAPLII